ncbi:MAG: DNA repair protein RecO [Deltaproteobacteria bacterium]|nr:DNA repair protein RecO [Deltaproteobacteria bacterium]
MAESLSSPAIVLRWRAYGDSDKIATLLTEQFGKLTGIAKGARNSRRRFPNSLEPLARVRVHFRQRPGASLAFLESCELLTPTDAFAEPNRFAYGSYLVELADRLTIEEDPVHSLYALLAEALAELEQGPATTGFLRAFELQLLTGAGFEPQLDACGRCQRPWMADETAWLSLHHGTVVCASCRAADDATVAVASPLLARLEALKNGRLATARRVGLGEHAADAALLTGRLLALHLARPLQSVQLIAQLRPTER